MDLGLIYDLQAEAVTGDPEAYKVVVQMTLTAPGCGMGPALAADARQRISTLPGVAESDHEQLGVRATTQLEQQRRYAHE